MSKEYEEAFRGSRQMCEGIKTKIKQYLIRYGENKSNEGAKNQLRYSMTILNCICINTQSGQGVHYDLYCDIIVDILGPFVNPEVSPTHWTRYLEFIRYLHYQIVEKKLQKEPAKLFQYVRRVPGKLQTQNDYKFIMSMYGTQLMSLKAFMNVSRNEIDQVFEALAELFAEMQSLNVKSGFVYPDFVGDFLQSVIVKRTPTVYMYFSQLPVSKKQMFEAFFSLIRNHNIPFSSSELINSYIESLLKASVVFLQLDIVDRLQMQLALQYLKACSEQISLKNEEAINYMLSLLFYMIKVIYGQSVRKYMEVCNKIQSFLQKSGEALMSEQWFIDSLIALDSFSVELYQKGAPSPFDGFLEEISSVDIALAFFRFVVNATKLAPYITQSKLVSLNCCTSVRKHFMLSLATSAMSLYSILEAKNKSQEENEELTKNLLLIFRNAVNIMESMNCIDKDSSSLRIFIGRFIQISTNANTSSRAEVCVKLSEMLVKLKHKMSSKDWNIILRRLYKTSRLLKDPSQNRKNEFHCFYIVSLVNVPNRDLTFIKNQITSYYTSDGTTTSTSPTITKDKCLSEVYAKSESIFKPSLNEEGRSCLLSSEMQFIIKYSKNNLPLMFSLLDYIEGDYDLVLFVRACKQQEKALQRLRILKDSLDSKDFGKLKRLEYLQYAHATSILLYNETDEMKQNFKVDTKDCNENNLDETFLKQNLKNFNTEKEVKLVQIALKSLKSFKYFWEKADRERISSDEALIDWEAVIDDLASLSTFLEMSGYLQYATDSWLLFYEITTTLQDSTNSIRAVAFLCDYVDIFSCSKRVDLEEIVEKASVIITQLLPSLPTCYKRVQNHVLQCLCHIAYFHAFKGNFVFAYVFLRLVEEQHALLEDRKGQTDIVVCLVMAVRFRLIWLHWDRMQNFDSFFEQKHILSHIENIIDQFQDITFFASTDSSSYMILTIRLTQQFVECCTNRLSDNFFISFLVAVIKLTIQSGLVLRTIHLLLMWMWSNLQMENVDKAQRKLKIIEHLFAIKPLNFNNKYSKLKALEAHNDMEHYSQNDEVCMESIRKIVPVHLSPIKSTKLELSPSESKGDLRRFINTKTISLSDPILQWSYYILGCLNSRLYYLIEDYEQLDTFYIESEKWLQKQQKMENNLYVKLYENIQTLAAQHYVNYLRAQQRTEKAIQIIEKSLKKAEQLDRFIDSSYFYNLQLQLVSTLLQENQQKEKANHVLQLPKRVLDFNCSPKEEKLVKSIKEKSIKIPALKLCKENKVPMDAGSNPSSGLNPKRNCFKNPRESVIILDDDENDDFNKCQIFDTIDLDDLEDCIENFDTKEKSLQNINKVAKNLENLDGCLNDLEQISLKNKNLTKSKSTLEQDVEALMTKQKIKAKARTNTKLSSKIARSNSASSIRTEENDENAGKSKDRSKNSSAKLKRSESADTAEALTSLTKTMSTLSLTSKTKKTRTNSKSSSKSNSLEDLHKEIISSASVSATGSLKPKEKPVKTTKSTSSTSVKTSSTKVSLKTSKKFNSSESLKTENAENLENNATSSNPNKENSTTSLSATAISRNLKMPTSKTASKTALRTTSKESLQGNEDDDNVFEIKNPLKTKKVPSKVKNSKETTSTSRKKTTTSTASELVPDLVPGNVKQDSTTTNSSVNAGKSGGTSKKTLKNSEKIISTESLSKPLESLTRTASTRRRMKT